MNYRFIIPCLHGNEKINNFFAGTKVDASVVVEARRGKKHLGTYFFTQSQARRI